MPYTKEHKARTRQLILQSAARLFLEKGYEATSIEQVMRQCGLTRGGFYAHFKSKSDLYALALRAADESEFEQAELPAREPQAVSLEWLESTFGARLDGGAARDDLSFLALDVGSRNPEVREAYSRALKLISERLCREMSDSPCNDDAPFATMAMMVGALAITATLDDEALKARIVAACRQTAQAMRDGESLLLPPSFLWNLNAPSSNEAH